MVILTYLVSTKIQFKSSLSNHTAYMKILVIDTYGEERISNVINDNNERNNVDMVLILIINFCQ